MSFKIAIASGKGGTGKTTVSVNLYHFLNKYTRYKVHLVDCDVEEPNDVLFFNKKEKESVTDVFQIIPQIDLQKCTYCEKCTDFCEFNAISIIPSVKYAEVNAELCHSCGACLYACAFGAIQEKQIPVGTINKYSLHKGEGLTEGVLRIGSAMQTTVIREVKKEVPAEQDIIIYDAPPGTSCPVVQTIADTDYTILVTEPTPFGLHDLKLAVDLLKELNIPFGVMVNKAGLGDNQVFDYLNAENIELLGSIPFDRKFAKQYATGKIINNIFPEAEKCYTGIIQKLEKTIAAK